MPKINSNIDPDLIKINGPINIIRLEGNIHGIQKVIYLFMDYHMDVTNQTECSNIFSEDVQKYFANTFYELNDNGKIYDFFLEIYPTELAKRKLVVAKQTDHRDMYIEEVVKFFKKIFRYDPRENRVEISDLFKNIRLHFIDVRDYYKTNITEQINEMKEITREFMARDFIRVADLDRIIDILYFMRQHLDFIVGILTQENYDITKAKLISPRKDTINLETLEYITSKIKEKYKYQDVKQEMNRLIAQSVDNFSDTINDIDAAIQQFSDYSKLLSNTGNNLTRDENTLYLYSYGLSIYTIRRMIVDIANRVDMLIDEQFIEYFARFTDIFFLRRFLDKDYITNAIVYTGGLHSNTYVYELVKNFNFKVTHASYSKISDYKKLSKEISNRSLMEIQELILPPKLAQCSDMTNFPANFE